MYEYTSFELLGSLDSHFDRIIERYSGMYGATAVRKEPWIIYFDNFTTPEEAKQLIDIGGREFKESGEGGSLDDSVVDLSSYPNRFSLPEVV